MDLGRALSSGSALIGLLPSARTRANLSGATGTEVIGDFVASIAFISQAMGKATSGHHNLDDLRRELKIPETLGGDKISLPSWPEGLPGGIEIGRVSCRESVCKYVSNSWGAGSYMKKKISI